MKHWVFDLDGTLVDSFPHYFVALSEIFDAHGAEFSDPLRLPALTQPLPEFFAKHLGLEAVPQAMSAIHEKSVRDATEIRTFPGVKDALRGLRESGSRIAVWTSRDLISAQLILNHSGLDPYVELCVSGSCTQERKPHPEGLLRIVDHFECRPEAVTMTGDHEYDVIAAKKIGARAVRASWHGAWDIELCSISDFQFHQIEDFREWMEKPQ